MTLFPIIVLIAIATGYLAGGRLRAFERLHLHWWPLAAVGLALQLMPVPDLRGDLERTVAGALVLASYPPLLLFAARNAAVVGLPTIFVGLMLNYGVIAANGSMPVRADAIATAGLDGAQTALSSDPKHHLLETDDQLQPLADVIGVPSPFRQVVSVGDLVVYVGVGMLTVAVMRGRTPGLVLPSPVPPEPLWWWRRAPQLTPAEQLAMWR